MDGDAATAVTAANSQRHQSSLGLADFWSAEKTAVGDKNGCTRRGKAYFRQVTVSHDVNAEVQNEHASHQIVEPMVFLGVLFVSVDGRRSDESAAKKERAVRFVNQACGGGSSRSQ